MKGESNECRLHTKSTEHHRLSGHKHRPPAEWNHEQFPGLSGNVDDHQQGLHRERPQQPHHGLQDHRPLPGGDLRDNHSATETGS